MGAKKSFYCFRSGIVKTLSIQVLFPDGKEETKPGRISESERRAHLARASLVCSGAAELKGGDLFSSLRQGGLAPLGRLFASFTQGSHTSRLP